MTYINMFKTLRRIMRDPLIAPRVIVLKSIAKRTFWWMLACEVVIVLQPYPIKWFFDGIQNHWEAHAMYSTCFLIGAAYFFGTLIHNHQAQLRNEFFWRVWGDLWGYSHFREMKLDTSWHVQHATGEKESIIARSIGKVERLVDELLFNTLPKALSVILTSIVVFWLWKPIGIQAIATMIVFGIALRSSELAMNPLRKEFRRKMKILETTGSEIVKNWRVLKQFGIEEDACTGHWNQLDDFCASEKHNNSVFSAHWKMQEHTVTVSRMVMYGSLVYWFSPSESLGSIVLATAWMERLFSNLYRFEGLQRSLNEGLEAARELCDILNLVPAIGQPVTPQWPAEGIQGEFNLCNVSFRFPNRKGATLSYLNLKINTNECLALIGRTGSGKTTLTSLLMREYDPDTGGCILVDGIDLRNIDYDRYRQEAIAIVSQKIELFNGTIIDNIRITKPGASFSDVIAAAKQADAHEFIVKLDRGYESQVGDDGIQISGGQRQRLAIARALIRKPRILILDEATSSLDGDSQKEVQKAISQLATSRQATIIIIAHRLSTIRQADRIVVLDEGKIAEIGSHDELSSKGGLYKYFLERELAGFSLS